MIYEVLLDGEQIGYFDNLDKAKFLVSKLTDSECYIIKVEKYATITCLVMRNVNGSIQYHNEKLLIP